jgi:hypothetical protein
VDEDGEPIYSSNDEFMQHSGEDAQGNFLPDDELERKRAAAAQKTPNKEDRKPATHWKPKRALYLSNNQDRDSVNETMNRKK